MKLLSTVIILLSYILCSLNGEAEKAILFNIDDRMVTQSQDYPVVSYADILQKATPAVVSVYTTRIVSASKNSKKGLRLDRFFRRFGNPDPEEDNDEELFGQRDYHERAGVGSGVIVSSEGYIVTNHHVVLDKGGEYVDEVRVRLNDGREFVAQLIGSDEKTDIAVLKIEVDGPLKAISIGNSENARVGDVVFAIGNPLEVGLTATQGIVSAYGRNSLGILGAGAYENFIQTDASINLGNSGGALIDAWGRLIGINTAIVSSRSGGSIGIGFSIPVNMVINVVTNLVENGEVPRGLLGLFPRNLDHEIAEAFDLKSTSGALVDMVQEGSPASNAGIQHGDIIVAVDNFDIESAPQLRLIVSQILPGTKVNVTLLRDNDKIVLPVILGSLNGTIEQSEREDYIFDGIKLISITNEWRGEYSIPNDINGVLVIGVSKDTPYRLIHPGMVILELNGTPVKSLEEIKENYKNGVNHLYTWSGGKKSFVVIRVKE